MTAPAPPFPRDRLPGTAARPPPIQEPHSASDQAEVREPGHVERLPQLRLPPAIGDHYRQPKIASRRARMTHGSTSTPVQ